MLGFLAANVVRRAEWLVEPELKGANLLTAERGMREALAHRFWIDQRRGWRFTNPNLEQLGLIEARYVSLDELARMARRLSRRQGRSAEPPRRNAKGGARSV